MIGALAGIEIISPWSKGNAMVLLICLTSIVAIVLLFRFLSIRSKRRNSLTAFDVADRIERHILGTEGPWDWDEFISVPITDNCLDRIRILCAEAEGNKEELGRIVEQLRGRTDRR